MKRFSVLMVLALLLASFAVPALGFAADAGATDAVSKLCEILDNIRYVLTMIAGGVGMLIVVLQGIKWVASADDPGARKQAKQRSHDE